MTYLRIALVIGISGILMGQTSSVRAQSIPVSRTLAVTMPSPAHPLPAEGVTQSTGELPFWASPEGLKPDPNRPGKTMADDHFRGDPHAPIAVVEFVDFQCPACRYHYEQTQPALDERFVNPGLVMWVFKHFPLPMHAQAAMAAASAECAAEQGKFWEMHDLLFETAEMWAVPDPKQPLTDLAGQLRLDTDAFVDCLTDEATLAPVETDIAEGMNLLHGVPTFFVIGGGQTSVILGALSAESFSARLQEVISSLGTEYWTERLFLPFVAAE